MTPFCFILKKIITINRVRKKFFFGVEKTNNFLGHIIFLKIKFCEKVTKIKKKFHNTHTLTQ